VPDTPRGVSGRGRELLTATPGGGGLPRVIEVPLAAGGLLVLAPVVAAAAAAIVATSGFPIFFRQDRVGREGRPFRLVKLRTMRPSSGGPDVTSRGDSRVTRVGSFLRRTKLDELPELWNVVRGDMSLVGPRPEVARYVQMDDPRWQEVLRVRPGLTDPVTLSLKDEEVLLAAVEGDREAYYREKLQPLKLAGYCEYLRRRTWKADIVVIWDTLRAIARPSGRSNGPSPDPRGA
jgi:lipopolysaccharide/colanic/teichoic acid biosynthesis glycosyltransferase